MADATVTQDGLIYTLSSDGSYYSVKAENKSITTANILPSIGGIPVTTIEVSAFYNCSSLTSITIPDSVTSIYSSAFSYCSALKTVIIGINVNGLGGSSFSNCTSLTTFIIKSNSYFREMSSGGSND